MGGATDAEIEGQLVLLMNAGRDTVAYMIATGTNMLLKNPEQLKALQDEPELIETGVEEILLEDLGLLAAQDFGVQLRQFAEFSHESG